ncbi:MAG: Asp23/Gls24 family envelope stress response protein [Bacillota bacterium]|nr:Asp23/Gls24 family envelope stress response protein [Bacillota bacterium]
MNNSINDASSLKVSDEVIAVCAANATLRTKGVADVAGDISDILTENLLGKENASKGIKASQNDDGITIDANIVVDYGTRIPELAWEIQENIRDEVEEMTGNKVLAVNINVQGVKLPSEE